MRRKVRKEGFSFKNKEKKLKIDAQETKDLKLFRRKLTSIEAKFSRFYFMQIFKLIPEDIRPERRRGFKAYNGVNNIFNLAYAMPAWKVHRAIINAKLEPYLGFLHSEQHGKPSLVCDFQELYRFLIDDFIIQYSKKIAKRDFIVKAEDLTKKKKGKREYLGDLKTKILTFELNKHFESIIEIPRIKVGKKQTIETLIKEEAMLLAKYLRREKEIWIPRLST